MQPLTKDYLSRRSTPPPRRQTPEDANISHDSHDTKHHRHVVRGGGASHAGGHTAHPSLATSGGGGRTVTVDSVSPANRGGAAAELRNSKGNLPTANSDSPRQARFAFSSSHTTEKSADVVSVLSICFFFFFFLFCNISFWFRALTFFAFFFFHSARSPARLKRCSACCLSPTRARARGPLTARVVACASR